MVFFFKQKTAYEMRISDWSSDVCSSDLLALQPEADLLAGHDTFEHRALGHLERHGSRGPVDAFDGFVSDRDASTGDIDGLDNANTEDKIGRASVREEVCREV